MTSPPSVGLTSGTLLSPPRPSTLHPTPSFTRSRSSSGSALGVGASSTGTSVGTGSTTTKRARSSSIVSVQEIVENYDDQLDQGALTNVNATWVNHKGECQVQFLLEVITGSHHPDNVDTHAHRVPNSDTDQAVRQIRVCDSRCRSRVGNQIIQHNLTRSDSTQQHPILFDCGIELTFHHLGFRRCMAHSCRSHLDWHRIARHHSRHDPRLGMDNRQLGLPISENQSSVRRCFLELLADVLTFVTGDLCRVSLRHWCSIRPHQQQRRVRPINVVGTD